MDHAGGHRRQPEIVKKALVGRPHPRNSAGGVAAALLELQRSAGNQAVGRLLQVQRNVVRGAATLRQDRNLADAILSGGANGITPPVLNTTEIPILQGTQAAAARAIKPPKISTKRAGFLSGDYTATVTSVPTNTVGANVYYPRNPPWITPAADPTRVAMVALGGGFQGANVGAGSCDTLDRRSQPTKFTVKGHGGDAEFLEAIRLHEMHHADDHWRAAQAVLAPWDLALQDQQRSNRGHTAPTAAAAKDKVYVEAGGTPDEIATKLDTLWVQLDSDFHASHEGRRSVIKQYSVNADGSEAVGWYDY